MPARAAPLLPPPGLSAVDASAKTRMAEAQERLEDVFGYKTFRPYQEAIIETLLAGGDALVLMPTGGGKSLCYQIPALVRDGHGRGRLAADRADAGPGRRAAQTRASSRLPELDARPADAGARSSATSRAGELDLLYVAPERLVQTARLRLLDRSEHRALRHRRSALRLAMGARLPAGVSAARRCCASAFPACRASRSPPRRTSARAQDIIERLRLEDARVFVASFDRPEHPLRHRRTWRTSARDQLLALPRKPSMPDDAGIVYCLSRKQVEETAAWLAAKGVARRCLSCRPRAAHRARGTRSVHQRGRRHHRRHDRLRHGHRQARRALRRPPRPAEERSRPTTRKPGRAGRDGEPADAWMTYGLQDVVQLRAVDRTVGGRRRLKHVQRQQARRADRACETWPAAGGRCCSPTSASASASLAATATTASSPPGDRGRHAVAQKALSAVYRTGPALRRRLPDRRADGQVGRADRAQRPRPV